MTKPIDLISRKQVLAILQTQIDDRTAKARQAFVSLQLLPTTDNCFHAGRRLSTEQRVCNLSAMGESEDEAGLCHPEKAARCPLFKHKRPPEDVAARFDTMTPTDLAIRWPSIGVLQRLRTQISNIPAAGQTDVEET